ncbi:glycosyltransferase [Pelagibacterium halotolerans]|uniref:glycosyltransferase n=1 Tax=Pelagibacterium halotolerans TaxID=531813 RepID=UPI00384D499B
MKILHVYKTYVPEDFTGVPRVIHAIAEGLADHGVESRVLALYGERPSDGPFQVGRHSVYPVRRDFEIASSGFSISAFGEFRRLSSDADIVHYHFPWPMGDMLYLTLGRHRPALITYHSDIVKQRRLLRIYEPMMHRFLGGADAIVATSPNYLSSSAVLDRYKDKVHVIPIGLPKRARLDEDLVKHWRQRVGEGFYLFVGALRYYKGIGTLIEAARQSGLPVVVAGSNDREELDIGQLPKNVAYVGEVSEADKEALLDLCAAFVFPSHLRSEAFGVALLEAARAGKPMISCELGTGTSFVNASGETGIVIAPADSGQLSHAMVQLDADKDLRDAMGREARLRFERLFRADTMSQGYLKLYHALASLPR